MKLSIAFIRGYYLSIAMVEYVEHCHPLASDDIFCLGSAKPKKEPVCCQGVKVIADHSECSFFRAYIAQFQEFVESEGHDR
jgi:hypothetical protein